jgi:hypothetical protein
MSTLLQAAVAALLLASAMVFAVRLPADGDPGVHLADGKAIRNSLPQPGSAGPEHVAIARD